MPMQPRTERGRTDRGQAVVFLLVVVAMVALSLIAIGAFGQRIVARGRAQTAADAAALAATVGGRVAAERLASVNGASLRAFTEADGAITVVVEVDGVSATARATAGP
jgi:hypothetical protein